MKTNTTMTAAEKDSMRQTATAIGKAQAQVEKAKSEIHSIHAVRQFTETSMAHRELMEAWDSLQRAQDRIQAILTA